MATKATIEYGMNRPGARGVLNETDDLLLPRIQTSSSGGEETSSDMASPSEAGRVAPVDLVNCSFGWISRLFVSFL